MYRPAHFAVDDVPTLLRFMQDRPFATLVSSGPLYATHLPTVTKDEGPHGRIECHLARANPQWEQLATNSEILVIFTGPQAYVAPAWYPSKLRHGKVLPTWNYSVVHAYGEPEPVEDEDWLLEHASPYGWATSSRARVPEGAIADLCGAS
jgi:transcriptional regulator